MQTRVRLGRAGRDHLPALDCMRGVAIAMVAFHHLGFHYPHDLDLIGRFLSGVGWIGVDVFFAISGYLITDILLRSTDSLKTFFIKRAFRILPLYFVAVAAYGLSGFLLGRDEVDDLWVTALFLTGWIVPFSLGSDVPYLITWSLSVEESAYILLAFLITLGRASYIRSIWFLVFGALLLRWVLVAFQIFEPQNVYYFPPTRIDSIAMGGLIAIFYSSVSAIKFRPALLVSASASILLWLQMRGQYNIAVAIWGYTLLSLCACAWVGYSIQIKKVSGVLWLALAHLGKRSYFFYLFHFFVIALITLPGVSAHLEFLGFWGNAALVFATTLCVAEVSWRVFEAPLIGYGRKISAHQKIRPLESSP